MYNRQGKKIIASILVFILTMAHFNIIGQVLANSLENQTTKTNIENIEFDAYFNEDEKVHLATKNIEEENYIYAAINVKEAGYLKDAQIEIKDANFEIVEGKIIEQASQIESNKIYLNKIKNGKTVEIAIPIQIMKEDGKINLSQFSKESELSLRGTYVNEEGKEKQVKKDITVNLSWTNAKQAELNSDIITYIPNYELNAKKVTIMQMSVESYLNNNTLPVKENKIEISIPTINNEKPAEVKVNVEKSNYIYDSNEGKLTIIVNNEADKNNYVSWEKQTKDEFVVTLIYSKSNDTAVEVSYDVKNELTVYESKLSKVSKEITVSKTLQEQIGNIVDFEIKVEREKISKGLLYANSEVEYKQSIIADVKLAKIGEESLLNEIIIEQQEDNFVTNENTKISAKDCTYYETISINKRSFEKILGDKGEIKIYSGNEGITTINSDVEANQEGNIIIDLPEGGFEKIEISSPISEGKLIFDVTKKISKDINYSQEQIEQFKKMELNLNIKESKNIAEKTITEEITFINPTSQAELIIDNTNLSTVVTNQNVKITAILKTDTEDCNLYTNPVLSITLPKYIEEIEIKNIEVLFDTQGSKLELKSYNTIKNIDGTQTIYIELSGSQSEYTLGAVSKGVNVVITSDITVNKLTANRQEQITMQYTNNNVNTNARSLGETGTISTAINFVAPTGLVTTTTVSDYEENKEPVTVISNEDKIITLPIMSKHANAKFTMNVINNYNNTIDNAVILGRTLFEGNKNILTGEDLQTNINMPLTSTITVSGVDASKVKIYYSENGEASKDLSIEENKWTEVVSDLSKVKSYLIILEDVTMNTSDSISFEYTAKVPKNLVHNKIAYENYIVYFNNNLETGTIQDKQMAAKIGLTTGKGPVLDVKMSSNVSETEVITTGKFIKYTVSVKNSGEEIAKNVVATVNIPKSTSYIEFFNGEAGQYTIDESKEQISFEMGNMEVGETVEKSFFVVVDKISVEDFCIDETHYEEYEGAKYHKRDAVHEKEDYKLTILAKATVSATDLSKELQSNEVGNNIKDAYFNISTSTTTNSMQILNEEDTFNFNISVRKYNVSDNITDAVVTYAIPEGLSYQKAYIKQYNEQTGKTEQIEEGIIYNEKTRTVSINLGEVSVNDNRSISIVTKVEKLPEGEYERQIKNMAKVSANGIEETSNIITDTIGKEGFEVVQTSNIPEKSNISAGDKFSYKIIVKNIGGNDIGTLKVTDNLPKELQYVNTEYVIGNETKTIVNINEENKTELTLNIPKGETATISINVVAKEVTENTTIENKATVVASSIEKTTNSITHIIEKYLEESKEEITDSNNNINNGNRKIMGTVWKDVNNNGERENEEEKVPNVEVVLFNNETGKYVESSEGQMLKVTTDNNGNYTFTNIPKGKYTIIYLYDVANYSATTYRKENVDSTINSDVVDTKITLNGEERLAGITEEIEVTDSNIYNIDLGIIENAKFDLRLDKTVSKITLQEGDKTTVYKYDDVKLAKKDLIGKEVNDVTIIVEYKIKVTNEGAVAGYVKKIADYMPSEMKFSSELNRDWYTGGNGVLFNSSLANTAINPGETKEVTLTLTKKMTENNLGIYHNEAEIYEAYNDLGLQDIDSKVANKVSSEDDMSSADVIMTVKTGQMISFVGLSISIITTIAVGAYFIKKKVLR